jgi:HTH-type transcriptional regulator, sugar sensing transcriptional regulator
LDFLIESLCQIGLSLNESKAYLCLLRKGGVTGYELSKNAGIPPSKIYESLNKLQTKGLISLIRSNHGQRYVAVEPMEILNRYQREYHSNLEGLKRQLVKIRQNPDAFNHYLWHLSERDHILRKIREIVKNSRKVIYLSIWKEELQEVEEVLRKAAKKGVKMAIVLYGDAKIDFGVVYEHSLEEILLREMGERRLSLVADNEVVLLAHFSNTGDSFGTWSYNRGMVNLAIDYITHDIISLKLVKQFEPQMNSIYGKKWERLRNVMVREPKTASIRPPR